MIRRTPSGKETKGITISQLRRQLWAIAGYFAAYGQRAAIGVAWYCARAVAAPVPVFDLLALVPPRHRACFDSWMGAAQGTMATVFTLAGLSGKDGVLISLLFGLVYVVTGCVGGLIWLASGTATPLEESESQQPVNS